MMRYLDYFLGLRCAPDIMAAVGRICKPSKEITETMSILRGVRSISLKDKMKYTLVDLCAGNCLNSITAIHFLPLKYAIAVDIRDRKDRITKRNRYSTEHSVDRFEYVQANIFEDEINIPEHSIIVSTHPCSNLAKRVIEIFEEAENAKAMFIMPCCHGKPEKFSVPTLIGDKLDSYEVWCYYLYNMISVKSKKIRHDNKVLSPKNIVISAWK